MTVHVDWRGELAVIESEHGHALIGASSTWAAKLLGIEADILWTLADISVRATQRGDGHGRELLAAALELADAAGAAIYLAVGEGREDDDPAGGLTRPQLREWYERHGFVVLPDLEEEDGSWVMTRQPR